MNHFYEEICNDLNKYDEETRKKIIEYKTYIKESEDTTVLKKLNKILPYFSTDEFKQRIKTAFNVIQDGWAKRDLSKALLFMSDGTFEQCQIRLKNLMKNNLKDMFENYKINKISFKKVESRLNSSTKYVSVYVTINYEAIYYLLNLKTGEFSGDKRNINYFSEIWCFMRREGSKEINTKGLIEGFCPNCGNSLEGSRLSICPYCNALLRSGQHDWILTSITKPSDWKDSRNNYVPGIFEVLKNDFSFNFQNIEDKITVMFWRLIEAIIEKKVNPILKIASNDFALEFGKTCFHPELKYYSDASIGSIEVAGFAKAEDVDNGKIIKEDSCSNNKDKVLLLAQVTWSGYEPQSNDLIFKKSLFILRRKIKTITDNKSQFSTLHCPNCGALETNPATNCCEYCDTVINDDNKDWILTNILDFNSIEAEKYFHYANQYEAKLQEEISRREKEGNTPIRTQIIAEDYFNKLADGSFLQTISTKDLLRLILSVALADGNIDTNELKSIKKICKLGFISDKELNKYLDSMKNINDPVNYALNTTAIKKDKDLLLLLTNLAAVDGKISENEAKILYSLADKMNIEKYKLKDEIYKTFKIKVMIP